MKKTLFVVFLAVLAMVAMYGTAYAISGTCSTCHTMHNSQDGATVAGASAQPNLLKSTCCACHGASGPSEAPNVETGDLAGGSFDQADDAKVHNPVCNITGLSTDDTLGGATPTPPGGTGAMSAQLRCSGTNGCHGTPSATADTISGFHHSPPAGMYRFLYANAAGSNVVSGEPSTTWEGTGGTSVDHNIYSSDLTYGISTFCARCHGNFHGTANTGSASPFTRHPTENDVTGDSTTVIVDFSGTPWAFPTAQFGSVSPTTNYSGQVANANVMCMSCHNAHGSAYDDMLKFDYLSITVGNSVNNGGCENCHYSKR